MVAKDAESELIGLAAQSNVTISTLDARGLYSASLDASTRGTEKEPIYLMLQARYVRAEMSFAEMSMAAIAAGTGGSFFHNSNDLEAGFKAVTQVTGVCLYPGTGTRQR